MPRRVAAGVSTLSRPEPARPITFNRSAASINSAVTFVPDRTISPSASLISLNSSSLVSFVFTTTVKPAFSSNSTPCFERLSLTRIFMKFLFTRPRIGVRLRLHHEEFLRLGHTAAEFNGMPHPFEHHLDRRHGRNHIEPIHIPHVRHTENLSLQMILPTRGRDAILNTQISIDRLPIDSIWSRN